MAIDMYVDSAASASTAVPATSQIAISRILSFGVVLGALVGKVPQILRILRAQSAEGVSLASLWMEVSFLGIQFGYNVIARTPLANFAELPILFVQNLVLVCVVTLYVGARLVSSLLGCCAITAVVVAMALGMLPPEATNALFGASVILGLGAGLPQLWRNWRSQSTGELSPTVALMGLSGSTTRLFTTLSEVDNVAIRGQSVLSWSMAAALVVQFALYRHAQDKSKRQ